MRRVPHLFQDGQALLDWLQRLPPVLDTLPGGEGRASIERAMNVLRTMVFTAGVTSVPDLWLLRQVLSTYRSRGLLTALLREAPVAPEVFARTHDLQPRQVCTDFHFLHARGYLDRRGDGFTISRAPGIRAVLQTLPELPPAYREDLVPLLVGRLSGTSTALPDRWPAFEAEARPTGTWVANAFQLECGFRLLPLVLALRVLERTASLTEGASLSPAVPADLPAAHRLLERAGYGAGGRVTRLGARVFARGPGPFGIIGAYHPYLHRLDDLLTTGNAAVHVRRGANVAASRDANRKTFEAANDALDAFCAATGFRYTVFIEHAVGQGEATRQRFERSGEATIRYFGADLEDAAIDEALALQRQGLLPRNMQFIRRADIGIPEQVLAPLREQGLAGAPTVMMVGNGFHEIRDPNNERMAAVFRAYQEAGFVLIFTEETALPDEDLRRTAWNTYHAGFRYVHALSGQGLRPVWEEAPDARWGWRRCATVGGYRILDRFTTRTRTIYPCPRPDRLNPSISVTYFCVPDALARTLTLD